MKFRTLLSIFLIVSLLNSCNNGDDSPNSGANDNTVTLSGFVRSVEDTPETDVKVSIGDFVNLTDYTDANGYFEIEGINKGEHDLNFFKDNFGFDTNVFVQQTLSVSLNANTSMDAITLPNPVELNPVSDITTSSALLSWNMSRDAGFREYKLYRHNSSGLDETTGTLVHVAVDINETSFLDENLNSSEEYFYRVFVLDEFGQIGGSNVISFETEGVQIIRNGSFEDVVNDIPNDWDLEPNDFGNSENSIVIDNTDSTNGINSLKFYHAIDTGCYEQWITQMIYNDAIVESATYRLTFDYKSDFSLDNSEVNLIMRNANFELDEWYSINLDFIGDEQWRSYEFEFTLPSDFASNNVTFTLNFCVFANANYWLDNIAMERID